MVILRVRQVIEFEYADVGDKDTELEATPERLAAVDQEYWERWPEMLVDFALDKEKEDGVCRIKTTVEPVRPEAPGQTAMDLIERTRWTRDEIAEALKVYADSIANGEWRPVAQHVLDLIAYSERPLRKAAVLRQAMAMQGFEGVK